jgi:hypothetical protein
VEARAMSMIVPTREDLEMASRFEEELRLPSILMLAERRRLASKFARVRMEERAKAALEIKHLRDALEKIAEHDGGPRDWASHTAKEALR